MDYIIIDDFGEFLILRRRDLTKEEFYKAIKCKSDFENSLQNNLFSLLCTQGFSVDEMYSAYLKDFKNTNLTLEEFTAWQFNISKEMVQDFFKSKKDGMECYFVDNVLINGYGENFILSNDYIDDSPEILEFQESFKEAIKNL